MKNIEKITKFCSNMTEAVGYPYFFNCSFPTNHVDRTEDGKIQDSTYFILRIGRYYEQRDVIIDGIEYEQHRSTLKEKQIFFGSVAQICRFTPFELMLYAEENGNLYPHDEYKSKSFEDVKNISEELKIKLEKSLNKNG